MSPMIIPAAKPIIGDEERAAVDRVLRSRHGRAGPRGRGLRDRVRRRSSTAGTCVAVNSGTVGAAPRAARRRRRPGRRGHRAVVHLRRDGQLGRARPARRRSSSTSSPTTSASTRPPSRPRSPTRTAGDHAGAPLRPPGRHGRARRRSPTGTACRSSRTPRRRTARPATARRSAPSATFAMFSLYPTKNMTSGEGGMVIDRRRRARPARPAAAQPGHGAAVRERDRRLQHPDDRHARRDRPGAADASWPAGPSSGSATRRSSTRTCEGVVVPPVADGATHVYHQYTIRVPEDRDGVRAGAARGARRRQRRLLPDPEPPAAVLPARPLDLPETERAAREVLSLPVHPSLTRGRPRARSSTAVNAVAEAGA